MSETATFKTTIKAYKLKNGQEAYGYIDTRKVDDVNPEIKVLVALGYIGDGSLYLGDEHSYLSAIETERPLTAKEYDEFLEKVAKLESDSLTAIEKLKKLKTL